MLPEGMLISLLLHTPLTLMPAMHPRRASETARWAQPSHAGQRMTEALGFVERATPV